MSAVNFNGEGALSAVSELQSCTMPSLLQKPTVTVPGSNSIASVEWTSPEQDGGCPVLSFHVYLRKLDVNEAWIEVDTAQIVD